jgi:hypothetical protein
MSERYLSLVEKQGEPQKEKPVIEDTDEGMMVVNPETAGARPVWNEAPEETGSLPLPNEPTMPPLHRAQRPAQPERPTVLGQGQEAIDPKTGKVIAKGEPKTFAPKTPKAAPVSQSRVEDAAQAALSANNGNMQKAIDVIGRTKSYTADEKNKIVARIRGLSPKGKLRTFSEEQMRKMAQPPAQ